MANGMDVQDKKKVIDDFGEWVIDDISKEIRMGNRVGPMSSQSAHQIELIGSLIKRIHFYRDNILTK